ncbi:MAG: fatty acid desaturase [Cyanobacteria bacterium M_surface_10_m2_179]|nr:fatty acid desaturase [Cyanobacteria bacterium M_surface_10_m2_179]
MQQSQLSNSGDFSLAPFRRSDNLRAVWQLLTTLVPTALLWATLPWIWQPLRLERLLIVPVLALLVLFSARSFALMHDCGHGSLFRSKALNRSVGFLLGVVNAIPQYPWSRGHAFHHLHNGNWERYRGPSALLTVAQFQQLTPQQQQRYGWSRHPLMLFPGGFSYLVLRPRLQLLLGLAEWVGAMAAEVRRDGWQALFSLVRRTKSFQSSHWYTGGEFTDLAANNGCVLTSWWLMSQWLGAGVFWSCYAIVMTCSAAIFICIFFVQHNFPESYAHRSNDWSYFKGAIEGSSNLILPRVLDWFSADIAFHSIHHLCERIPNYRLRACHAANQHLLDDCTYLRLRDLPRCFKLILWDSGKQRLVSMAEV